MFSVVHLLGGILGLVCIEEGRVALMIHGVKARLLWQAGGKGEREIDDGWLVVSKHNPGVLRHLVICRVTAL